jgi:hypothetical protein
LTDKLKYCQITSDNKMKDQVIDEWVPDTQLRRELNTTAMSLWRWTHDPAMGFPQVIKLGRRNFRSRAAIEAWKAKVIAQSPQPDPEAHERRRERLRKRREAGKKTAA